MKLHVKKYALYLAEAFIGTSFPYTTQLNKHYPWCSSFEIRIDLLASKSPRYLVSCLCETSCKERCTLPCIGLYWHPISLHNSIDQDLRKWPSFEFEIRLLASKAPRCLVSCLCETSCKEMCTLPCLGLYWHPISLHHSIDQDLTQCSSFEFRIRLLASQNP